MKRLLLPLACLCLCLPSLLKAQAPGPGQGPRIDYRDEDWKFWWFLNRERLLEERRVELRAADGVVSLVPLTDPDRTDVVAGLRAALADSSPELHRALLMALARSGDRAVLPRLLAGTKNGNLEIRRMAVRALGVLGDPAAISPLREILDDRNLEQSLRTDAVLALALLRDDAPPTADSEDDEVAPAAPTKPLLELASASAVTSLNWRPSSNQVSLSHAAGHVALLFAADGAMSLPVPEGDSPATASAWNPAGEQLAVSFEDGRLLLYDAGRDRTTSPFKSLGSPTAIDWDPGRGERLVVATQAGTARVVVPRKGQRLALLEGHAGPLTCVDWKPHEERIATGSEDGSVRVWSARSGRELGRIDLGGRITAIEWSPAGELLAATSDLGILYTWDGKKDSTPSLFLTGETPLMDVAWSADGARLAVARKDGMVDLFDVRTRARIERFEGLLEGARFLAFSEDGKRLATTALDGMLRIFAVTTAPTGGVRGKDTPTTPVGAALLELLEREQFFGYETVIRTGIAMAVGLADRPELGESVRELLTARKSLNTVTRCYLILSLGRMGDADGLDALLKFVKDKDVLARRSAALALGALLEDSREAKALTAITKQDARESSITVRNFLKIAMGRLGWTASPALYEKLSGDRRGVFGRGGIAGAPRISLGGLSEQPFASLAVGLSKDRRAYRLVLDSFTHERVHSIRSALAIALGLYGDAHAGKALLKVLRSSSDPEQDSYVILALGMVGEQQANDDIRRILAQEIDIELLPAAARAAKMLGGASALQTLLARLQEEHRPEARRAVLYCIGLLGGRNAVDPLLRVLADGNEPDHVRAYAAIALGEVIDQHDVRIWARVLEDFNYTAEPNLFLDLLRTL